MLYFLHSLSDCNFLGLGCQIINQFSPKEKTKTVLYTFKQIYKPLMRAVVLCLSLQVRKNIQENGHSPNGSCDIDFTKIVI